MLKGICITFALLAMWPTIVIAQPDSAACLRLKAVGDRLRQQQEAASERLNTDECGGSARTICMARLKQIADLLRMNAEQTKAACSGHQQSYTPPPERCPLSSSPTKHDYPRILEIRSVSGTGPYVNPDYDTSGQEWAKQVCGGDTWLSGGDPPYEWMPILDRRSELEDVEVGISGTALNAHPSGEDVWFTHPFGNDVNFDILPDADYLRLTSPILKEDPDPQGPTNSLCRARTEFGLDIANVLHVEIDSKFVPKNYDVREGDRVAALGRWIVDCGHDYYSAEVHPPLVVVAARPLETNADTTRASIISRPFLVSQEFGDGALYHHLVNQLFQVYPPLLPFPVTSQVEARPGVIQKPFSGMKQFNVVLHPPTPRKSPRDVLAMSYSIAARPGVAVQFYATQDDGIGMTVTFNSAEYATASLPPRHNRNVSKGEIQKVRPDVGDLIFYFQGSGSSLAQPFGAIVLEKGVDTDEYDMPTVVEAPPLTVTAPQLTSVKIAQSTAAPWPILGHIDVSWRRDILALIDITSRILRIPANQMWVDTGVVLQKGQAIHIEASGAWSNAGPPTLGPDGWIGYQYPGTLVQNASLGCLVAKVGASTFQVGRAFEGESPDSGTLFLSINDVPSTFADNEGEVAVTVKLPWVVAELRPQRGGRP